MTGVEIVEWAHLVAGAVWLGGLITLGALVPAARAAGADRAIIREMARRFGRVSWTAMAIAIATGVSLRASTGIPWDDGTLTVKMSLIALSIALALTHQLTASKTSAAVRGVVQGAILLLGIGVFAAAVAL